MVAHRSSAPPAAPILAPTEKISPGTVRNGVRGWIVVLLILATFGAGTGLGFLIAHYYTL